MLDIVHRSGFPLVEAQRIQSKTALKNDKMLEARNYALLLFMERPHVEDWVHVTRWIHASRHHFETRSPNLSRQEVLEAAKQDCYCVSPYEKKTCCACITCE